VTIIYADAVSVAAPNVRVDATSPHGATVTYPTPVATDALGLITPPVSCLPASDRVFKIGVTTVTCTATDPYAANSPLQVSFTVTVEGAAAQLADLATLLQTVRNGNLVAPDITGAQAALAAGLPQLAVLDLDKFIAAVTVLGHAGVIPAATAPELIAAAEQIINVIGVPA